MEGLIFIALLGIFFWAVRGAFKSANYKELERIREELRQKDQELGLCLELQKNQAAGVRESEKRLVKTISHELRIPISIIKGYSDILSEGLVEDEESKQKYINKISEKANHLSELVASMVSELEKNLEECPKEGRPKCDLLKVVQGVAEDFSLAAEKKQIVIHVYQSHDSIQVACDEVRITQVVSNIVNNSIKYMGRPGTIQLSLGYSEENEVTLIIRDNGEGMDREAVNGIFEAPQGLGLKICRETVEGYGGSIWCKSERGKGMAVYLILPAPEIG